MEDSVESSLQQRAQDLHETLESLRTKEFNYAVSELKQSLSKQNRCIVCTLQLPCKHFASGEEMPEVQVPLKEKFSLYKYTKGLNINALSLVSSPYSKKLALKYTDHPLSNSPRYRNSVPNTSRIKNLEMIETFREQRLKKEIDRIENLKKEKTEEAKNREIEKQKLFKKTERLRKKVDEYRTALKNKYTEQPDIKDTKKEEKRKLYLQEQKKKLAEYHEKKRIGDIITKQKTDEVHAKTLKYDPKKIYLNV